MKVGMSNLKETNKKDRKTIFQEEKEKKEERSRKEERRKLK